MSKLDIPALTIDVEIFPNFALVGVRDLVSGVVQQWTTEPGIGGTLDEARAWYQVAKNEALFIGFNSMPYDNVLLRAILVDGVDDVAELFELSKATIVAKSFQVGRATIGGELSCDLLAIHGGQNARIGSLKEIGVKLDYPHLQELPYPFDAVLEHDQMVEVAAYNVHDLRITALAAEISAEQVMARLALAAEYNEVSLLNKHDAGVAVTVLAAKLFSNTSTQWPNATQWRCKGSRFANLFSYRNPALADMLARVAGWDMEFKLDVTTTGGETEKRIVGPAFSDAVTVGDGAADQPPLALKIGVGGLHSEDSASVWVADEKFRILDFDVSSFYPALIINHRLAPQHLFKKAFLAAFEGLRDRRLQAKAAGDKALADGLKISINSIFGKTKSAYSWLLDPVMSVGVTILGQLSLLVFVDGLADVEGVDILSANTDGLCIRVTREHAEIVIHAMHAQAALMGFTLDLTEYSRIARRDVNNYLAVGLDGKLLKAKGAYGYEQRNLAKKATNRIVIDAVQQYFINGVPPDVTIRASTDIRAFVDYFKATKGYHIVDADGRSYGGIARWYLSDNGVHLDKQRIADGQLTQLVEVGAVVIDELPTEMPAGVAYAAYEAMAGKLIAAIEHPPVATPWTVPLGDLSQAQHAQQRHNMITVLADLAVVDAVDLETAHRNYAKRHKGNAYSSMKSIAVAVWCAGRGELTQGDLLALLRRVDAADGYFTGRYKRTLDDLAAWVAREISPWPLPRTTEEQVERAMTWAAEKIEPLKRRRKALTHRAVLNSDFVTGPALRKFQKGGDEYALACSISAVAVKHAKPVEAGFVVGIIGEIKTYLSEGI